MCDPVDVMVLLAPRYCHLKLVVIVALLISRFLVMPLPLVKIKTETVRPARLSVPLVILIVPPAGLIQLSARVTEPLPVLRTKMLNPPAPLPFVVRVAAEVPYNSIPAFMVTVGCCTIDPYTLNEEVADSLKVIVPT